MSIGETEDSSRPILVRLAVCEAKLLKAVDKSKYGEPDIYEVQDVLLEVTRILIEMTQRGVHHTHA